MTVAASHALASASGFLGGENECGGGGRCGGGCENGNVAR